MSKKYFSEVLLLTKSFYNNEVECWLNWYINVIKFDHVVIFDNESIADVENIANSFGNKVTYYKVIGWPNQYKLYNDYLQSTESQWSITLDDDEYLYIADKYGGDVNRLISHLYSTYNKNKYYIMWTNMFSKDKMPVHDGLLINTHTYYSYDAINSVKGISFNRNDLGKCIHNNDFKYIYSCFTDSVGHIPKCIDGDNTTILVNNGSETQREIINCKYCNVDCFIAHYQFKNSHDWIRKSESQSAQSQGIHLQCIKPVYDLIYKHNDSFVECNLLKDRYAKYLSENS